MSARRESQWGVTSALVRRFIYEERGTMTIEFVLWVPILVGLLITAIDATTLFVMHTEMSNVARDTARRMAAGSVRSEAEAEAYALSAMNMRTGPYAVEAHYDPDNVIAFRIAIAFEDLSILGYNSPLRIFGSTIRAHAVMRPDPRVPFGGTTEKDKGGGKNA